MNATDSDLHRYLDFKELLKDRYQQLRESDSKFSHRYLSRMGGYGSASGFSDVLTGRRKLSKASALRLAKALQFTKAEEDYFLCLVDFNQAESLEEKNLHYAKLLNQKIIRIDILSPDKYEYFSKWHHAAIRELLYFHPFTGDYKELGRKLNPAVPAAEIKKSVQLLVRLGLLAKDEQGRYRQTSKLISTEDAVTSLHVDNFKASMMKLAIESLDRHSPSVRNISTVTATLSAASLAKAKLAIQTLRQTLMTLAEQDEKVDRVYQLNIQLFPLSRE